MYERELLMLTLLIPGPKSLGKDIDVYLRPLIDDLKDLWALKDSDDEDLASDEDDDDVAVVYSIDVARGHDVDGGGDDRPPPCQIHTGNSKTQQERQESQQTRYPRANQEPQVKEDYRSMGLIVREFPMHYPSWHKILAERKAGVIRNIRSSCVVWAICDLGYGAFGYAFIELTYFDAHTVDGVILRDEERLLYEEMLRLKDLGPTSLTGVPYTDDEIMAMVRQGKQQRHIPGVVRVLARQGRDVLTIPEPRCTHTADVNEVKKENKQLGKDINMLMKVVRSDDKMSQLLTQLQLQHEVVSGSGSAVARMMSRARKRGR
nr:hypothetical protein [Tanacetum cinerariifolium]